MKLLSTTVTPTTAYMGDTITLASEVSETISSSHFAMWIIDFDATTDPSTPIFELINQGRVINSEWALFSSKTDMSRTVQIDEDMLNIHTLTFILSQSSSMGISISDNPELFTIGDNISVSFKLHLYDKVKKLGNQWFYLKDEVNTLLSQEFYFDGNDFVIISDEPTITKTLTIQWNDNNDAEKLRPRYLQVPIGDITAYLSEENDWSVSIPVDSESSDLWNIPSVPEYMGTMEEVDDTTTMFTYNKRSFIVSPSDSPGSDEELNSDPIKVDIDELE